MSTAELPMPTVTLPEICWFSATGSVTRYEDRCEVHVGGVEVGCWTPDELGPRNVLMVQLSFDPKTRQGRLSEAFGVNPDTLRRMRIVARDKGMDAVYSRRRGGSESKVTPTQRRALSALFARGHTAYSAHREAGQRLGLCRTTIWRVHVEWLASHEEQSEAEVASPRPRARPKPTQPSLPFLEAAPRTSEEEQVEEADTEEVGDAETSTIADAPVRGGRGVQFVGAWLMVAMVARLGLHEAVTRLWNERRGSGSLRVSLDALIIALSLGHGCVEGIRRIATATASTLLRARQCPSPSWVRRVFRQFVDKVGSASIHLTMAGRYLDDLRGDEGPVVLYVDNHMRPYAGQYTVRHGFRMQDNRARPGITDYYVHDEWGNPLFRVDVPSHDSLTQWLPILARTVRRKYGSSERILLAFDRAGAYPQHLADLRVEGFEFVTYERKPYAKLPRKLFSASTLKGGPVGIYDGRAKNLGRGRGRVRRIALRKPDGSQVNLLAVSRESAQFLVTVMLRDGGRWVQENAFKHGAQRWGLNRLDSNRVTPYSPDAVIPNPARRRLDRSLRHSHEREGTLRRKLARLASDATKRDELERSLADELLLQQTLLQSRPATPSRARVADTELADELVRHDSHFKTLIDTVRIACANAESELAYALAPHLPKADDAKRALAALFAAPGDVRVTAKSVIVTLSPAGTAREQRAYTELFRQCDDWSLTLPGDRLQRPLRFRIIPK